MARYIDADAFLEKFKSALENAQHYGLYNHAKITQYVMKSIENEPTADVAPKSEVLRLQSEVNRLKKYDEERDIALHARLISGTKTETAREIFAEITNLLLSLVYLGADCKWHTAKKYANKLHSFMEGYLELQEKHCGNDTNVPTKKTNFDRIKEMTVDEMAKFIPDWSYTGACKCGEKSYVDCNNECENCVKEWLESEVKT